jgi:HlyD family secretion protein
VQYRVASPAVSAPAVLNMVDLSVTVFFLTGGRPPSPSAARFGWSSTLPPVPRPRTSRGRRGPVHAKRRNAVERLKLMFRIKANIDPALLSKHLEQVKTGLPGVAYVRTDPKVDWPANLKVNLPQ